jgi:hypothetical protein
MAAHNLLVVGAHCRVYINNQPFGRIADFGADETTSRKEVKVVDYLPPFELIQTGASARFNASIYRLHMDGGIEGAGLKSVWPDLPREKYFSFLVLDRLTDTVLFRADKCSVEHQSWRVGRGFVMGTISFVVLDFSNETQATSET